MNEGMQKKHAPNEAMAATSFNPEAALDSHQVGEYLGKSIVTLAQYRMRGEGPPFFRIGRSVRYRLGDVLAYRDANTVGKKVAK